MYLISKARFELVLNYQHYDYETLKPTGQELSNVIRSLEFKEITLEEDFYEPVKRIDPTAIIVKIDGYPVGRIPYVNSPFVHQAKLLAERGIVKMNQRAGYEDLENLNLQDTYVTVVVWYEIDLYTDDQEVLSYFKDFNFSSLDVIRDLPHGSLDNEETEELNA